MCTCIAVRGNHYITGGSILISLRKKLNLISMSDVNERDDDESERQEGKFGCGFVLGLVFHPSIHL
jgi:hypothetical protein